MTSLKISVYKESGKWYTTEDVYSEEYIAMEDYDGFKAFVAKNLPAHCENGYVVVEDRPGGIGFHNHLFLYNELKKYI